MAFDRSIFVPPVSLPPSVVGPLHGELDVEIGTLPAGLVVRLHWWGESSEDGTILAPDSRNLFALRTNRQRMLAYLSDVGQMSLEVVDTQNNQAVGTVKVPLRFRPGIGGSSDLVVQGKFTFWGPTEISSSILGELEVGMKLRFGPNSLLSKTSKLSESVAQQTQAESTQQHPSDPVKNASPSRPTTEDGGGGDGAAVRLLEPVMTSFQMHEAMANADATDALPAFPNQLQQTRQTRRQQHRQQTRQYQNDTGGGATNAATATTQQGRYQPPEARGLAPTMPGMQSPSPKQMIPSDTEQNSILERKHEPQQQHGRRRQRQEVGGNQHAPPPLPPTRDAERADGQNEEKEERESSETKSGNGGGDGGIGGGSGVEEARAPSPPPVVPPRAAPAVVSSDEPDEPEEEEEEEEEAYLSELLHRGARLRQALGAALGQQQQQQQRAMPKGSSGSGGGENSGGASEYSQPSVAAAAAATTAPTLPPGETSSSIDAVLAAFSIPTTRNEREEQRPPHLHHPHHPHHPHQLDGRVRRRPALPPGVGDPWEAAVDLDLDLSGGRRGRRGGGGDDSSSLGGRGGGASSSSAGVVGGGHLECEPLDTGRLSLDDRELDALLKVVGPSPVSVAYPALAKLDQERSVAVEAVRFAKVSITRLALWQPQQQQTQPQQTVATMHSVVGGDARFLHATHVRFALPPGAVPPPRSLLHDAPSASNPGAPQASAQASRGGGGGGGAVDASGVVMVPLPPAAKGGKDSLTTTTRRLPLRSVPPNRVQQHSGGGDLHLVQPQGATALAHETAMGLTLGNDLVDAWRTTEVVFELVHVVGGSYSQTPSSSSSSAAATAAGRGGRGRGRGGGGGGGRGNSGGSSIRETPPPSSPVLFEPGTVLVLGHARLPLLDVLLSPSLKVHATLDVALNLPQAKEKAASTGSGENAGAVVVVCGALTVEVQLLALGDGGGGENQAGMHAGEKKEAYTRSTTILGPRSLDTPQQQQQQQQQQQWGQEGQVGRVGVLEWGLPADNASHAAFAPLPPPPCPVLLRTALLQLTTQGIEATSSAVVAAAAAAAEKTTPARTASAKVVVDAARYRLRYRDAVAPLLHEAAQAVLAGGADSLAPAPAHHHTTTGKWATGTNPPAATVWFGYEALTPLSLTPAIAAGLAKQTQVIEVWFLESAKEEDRRRGGSTNEEEVVVADGGGDGSGEWTLLGLVKVPLGPYFSGVLVPLDASALTATPHCQAALRGSFEVVSPFTGKAVAGGVVLDLSLCLGTHAQVEALANREQPSTRKQQTPVLPAPPTPMTLQQQPTTVRGDEATHIHASDDPITPAASLLPRLAATALTPPSPPRYDDRETPSEAKQPVEKQQQQQQQQQQEQTRPQQHQREATPLSPEEPERLLTTSPEKLLAPSSSLAAGGRQGRGGLSQVKHVVEVSVSGTCEALLSCLSSPAASSSSSSSLRTAAAAAAAGSEDFGDFGCWVRYRLPDEEGSNTVLLTSSSPPSADANGMEATNLWWDGDSAFLNSRARHAFSHDGGGGGDSDNNGGSAGGGGGSSSAVSALLRSEASGLELVIMHMRSMGTKKSHATSSSRDPTEEEEETPANHANEEVKEVGEEVGRCLLARSVLEQLTSASSKAASSQVLRLPIKLAGKFKAAAAAAAGGNNNGEEVVLPLAVTYRRELRTSIVQRSKEAKERVLLLSREGSGVRGKVESDNSSGSGGGAGGSGVDSDFFTSESEQTGNGGTGAGSSSSEWEEGHKGSRPRYPREQRPPPPPLLQRKSSGQKGLLVGATGFESGESKGLLLSRASTTVEHRLPATSTIVVEVGQVKHVARLVRRHLRHTAGKGQCQQQQRKQERVVVSFDFFLGGQGEEFKSVRQQHHHRGSDESQSESDASGGVGSGQWIRFESDPLLVDLSAVDDDGGKDEDVIASSSSSLSATFACSAQAKVTIDGSLIEWLHRGELLLSFTLLPPRAAAASAAAAAAAAANTAATPQPQPQHLGFAVVPLQRLLVTAGGLRSWVPIKAAAATGGISGSVGGGGDAIVDGDQSNNGDDVSVHVSLFFHHRRHRRLRRDDTGDGIDDDRDLNSGDGESCKEEVKSADEKREETTTTITSGATAITTAADAAAASTAEGEMLNDNVVSAPAALPRQRQNLLTPSHSNRHREEREDGCAMTVDELMASVFGPSLHASSPQTILHTPVIAKASQLDSIVGQGKDITMIEEDSEARASVNKLKGFSGDEEQNEGAGWHLEVTMDRGAQLFLLPGGDVGTPSSEESPSCLWYLTWEWPAQLLSSTSSDMLRRGICSSLGGGGDERVFSTPLESSARGSPVWEHKVETLLRRTSETSDKCDDGGECDNALNEMFDGAQLCVKVWQRLGCWSDWWNNEPPGSAAVSAGADAASGKGSGGGVVCRGGNHTEVQIGDRLVGTAVVDLSLLAPRYHGGVSGWYHVVDARTPFAESHGQLLVSARVVQRGGRGREMERKSSSMSGEGTLDEENCEKGRPSGSYDRDDVCVDGGREGVLLSSTVLPSPSRSSLLEPFLEQCEGGGFEDRAPAPFPGLLMRIEEEGGGKLATPKEGTRRDLSQVMASLDRMHTRLTLFTSDVIDEDVEAPPPSFDEGGELDDEDAAAAVAAAVEEEVETVDEASAAAAAETRSVEGTVEAETVVAAAEAAAEVETPATETTSDFFAQTSAAVAAVAEEEASTAAEIAAEIDTSVFEESPEANSLKEVEEEDDAEEEKDAEEEASAAAETAIVDAETPALGNKMLPEAEAEAQTTPAKAVIDASVEAPGGTAVEATAVKKSAPVVEVTAEVETMTAKESLAAAQQEVAAGSDAVVAVETTALEAVSVTSGNATAYTDTAAATAVEADEEASAVVEIVIDEALSAALVAPVSAVETAKTGTVVVVAATAEAGELEEAEGATETMKLEAALNQNEGSSEIGKTLDDEDEGGAGLLDNITASAEPCNVGGNVEVFGEEIDGDAASVSPIQRPLPGGSSLEHAAADGMAMAMITVVDDEAAGVDDATEEMKARNTSYELSVNFPDDTDASAANLLDGDPAAASAVSLELAYSDETSDESSAHKKDTASAATSAAETEAAATEDSDMLAAASAAAEATAEAATISATISATKTVAAEGSDLLPPAATAVEVGEAAASATALSSEAFVLRRLEEVDARALKAAEDIAKRTDEALRAMEATVAKMALVAREQREAQGAQVGEVEERRGGEAEGLEQTFLALHTQAQAQLLPDDVGEGGSDEDCDDEDDENTEVIAGGSQKTSTAADRLQTNDEAFDDSSDSDDDDYDDDDDDGGGGGDSDYGVSWGHPRNHTKPPHHRDRNKEENIDAPSQRRTAKAAAAAAAAAAPIRPADSDSNAGSGSSGKPPRSRGNDSSRGSPHANKAVLRSRFADAETERIARIMQGALSSSSALASSSSSSHLYPWESASFDGSFDGGGGGGRGGDSDFDDLSNSWGGDDGIGWEEQSNRRRQTSSSPSNSSDFSI